MLLISDGRNSGGDIVLRELPPVDVSSDVYESHLIGLVPDTTAGPASCEQSSCEVSKIAIGIPTHVQNDILYIITVSTDSWTV